MTKWFSHLCLSVSLAFLVSCSGSSGERAAKHESRGDAYLQQEKFREAVIEYKNAARATPDSPAIQWKLAQAASKVGDPPTAYRALRRVLELDPSHFEAKWSLGDLYLTAGKTEEAGKLAEELFAAKPDHPASYLLRAGVDLGADRVPDAIRSLKQAAELDPMMLRPILSLASIYFAHQDLTSAREWYDRALKVAPNSADVRVARGHFLFATGITEEGRKEFRTAVELSPNQELIKLLIADSYVALGRRDEAEQELAGLIADTNSHKARKALAELKLATGQVGEAKLLVNAMLEADEHDPVGIYLKGRIALAENDVLQAIGLFEESIGRDATLSGSHLYLGLARLAQGRVDSAQKELGEAIRLQPDNEAAHLTLAKLYLAQQKPSEAEHEAWQALRSNPSNPEAALLAGDALAQAKNWTKAEGVYGEIVRQLPEQPAGYVKLAVLRKLQGRPVEAAALFAQALSHASDDLAILQDYLTALVESNQASQADRLLQEHLTKAPRDPNVWRLAGRQYVAQRKLDQAEKAFRKAADLAPDVALVHYELGQLYLFERKLPAAESAFQAALKKDESNSEVHTALGMVLASQGRVEAANVHYRRAVQLDPNNAVAANNLAAGLSEQQELDEALGLALAALERAPANPAIKDTLGWIYYKKNRFEDAHRLLAEASAALPQNPAVRYHHAMTLSKVGKQKEALVELKQALAFPGGFPGADRAAQMVASNRIEEPNRIEESDQTEESNQIEEPKKSEE